MYWNRKLAAAERLSSVHQPSSRCGGILAVGDVAAWTRTGRGNFGTNEIVFAAFHEVDEGLLLETDPRMVVSPLITRHFDCADLAVRLGQLGYRGRYRAVGAALPNPGIIEAEIRALVPGLDFAVRTDWSPGPAS